MGEPKDDSDSDIMIVDGPGGNVIATIPQAKSEGGDQSKALVSAKPVDAKQLERYMQEDIDIKRWTVMKGLCFKMGICQLCQGVVASSMTVLFQKDETEKAYTK